MNWRLFEIFLKEEKLAVQRDFPLAPFTTFKIGGKASYILEPTNLEETQKAIRAASECELPLYFLGKGSNVLVRDEGIKGVVLRSRKLQHLEACDSAFRVGAGYLLTTLIHKTIELGLGGVEHLGGIPASIGGAITMNAGGKYGDISSAVQEVVSIDKMGTLRHFSKNDLAFNYRSSNFKSNLLMVVEVMLQLKPSESVVLQQRYNEILKEKKASQPLGSPNVGCIFKNSPKGEAGRLIDQCGLKGARIGAAHVSRKHANFIINERGATARDVLALIDLIREKVSKECGVELEPEIIVW